LIVLEVATPLTNIDAPKANILGKGWIKHFFEWLVQPPTIFFGRIDFGENSGKY